MSYSSLFWIELESGVQEIKISIGIKKYGKNSFLSKRFFYILIFATRDHIK